MILNITMSIIKQRQDTTTGASLSQKADTFFHTHTNIFIMKLITCIFLLWLPFIGWAQNGSVQGKILDKQNQEALIGAVITIEGTEIGAATDYEGAYLLENVVPGTYNLKISYLGYEEKLIKDVVVRGGEITTLDIMLGVQEGLLSEVTVVSFRTTNTETAVAMELKKSNSIASGISSQQIAKSLDRDAAQVVKRIPGITIMGNFINIRGLNPRYNNVMLQSAVAPSLETDVKSFSFDMIPTGQLDRIIVIKSPSSEVTSDFAGGLVKIYTKSIPDSNYTSISYNTSFRTGTSFQQFKQQQHGKGFWAGFNGDYHNLPASFPQDVQSINSADELVAAGQSLKNDWNISEKTAIPDQRFGVAKGIRIQTKNGLIGSITALNYSNSRTTFKINRSDFNNFDVEKNAPSPIYAFEDNQYTVNTRTNILHNWSFKFKNHLIEFKNIGNFSATGQYVFREGEDYEFNYLPNNHSFDQVFKGLYSGQLSGSHKIMKDAAKVDWLVGYSNAFRNQPDYKRYRSDKDAETGATTLYVPVGSAQANFLGRFYSLMKENIVTALGNFSYKIGYAKGNSFIPTLSTGYYMEYKNRSFDARNIGFVRGNIGSFDNNLLNSGIDNLFQPQNINPTTGVNIDEQTNPSDNYQAHNLLNSFFVNTELPFKKFKIITGARLEYNIQQLKSADFTDKPIEVKNPVFKVLPSLNVSYNISEEMLVRAAYGMSINRPEFREIAPFGFYDFNYNFTYKGNPNLGSSTIHNAEVKLEWFPMAGDVINVGGFYKHFINPIEVVAVPGGGSGGAKNFSFANAETAELFGVEVEIKKGFSNASNPFLKNLGISFNGSYINSNIKLGKEAVGQSDNRPLQGQSPYIVNAGLYYSDEARNYQVNILYNVTGKRILFVGFDEYPDIYELSRHGLEVSGSYKFKFGMELNAGVSDLVNQSVLLVQDGNNDGTISRTNDQQIQSYVPGRVFNFGVKYTF